MGNIGSKNIEKPQPVLPPEIIMEILSRLPLKSLSKCQLVCKEWRELIIHDHHFIGKHMNHNKLNWHWHNVTVPSSTSWRSKTENDSFRYIHGCDGLVIIKNNTAHKYCLWNPATRCALELPDPHGYTHGLSLSYVPSTRNYRIVSIYSDEETGLEACEIFTPGNSKAWRHLTFPDINDIGYKTGRVAVVSAKGVVHCILVLCNDEETVRKIVSLDLETECFIVNQLPKGTFKGNKTVWDLDWNGEIAFAGINEQTLEVMELEDYKKGRWCVQKKEISLKFVEKYKYSLDDIFPLFAKDGDIWFWLKNEKIFTCRIETGEIAHIKRSEAFSLENKLYIYKPSLITFEGMQPDTTMECLRPTHFD